MKKELFRGLTMVMLVVVFALATAVASANAQSSNKVVANIPFEFVVGGETLPAGEYLVTAQAQDKALRIESTDAKISAARLASSIEARNDETDARLVFRRYGERYFLAEVWSGSDSTGRQLLKSREERGIERELRTIAAQSSKSDRTYDNVEVMAHARSRSH